MTYSLHPETFVSELQETRFPNTFNPYADHCQAFDKPDAPKLRSRILREILVAACDVELDAIWVGRDLGHRGGRRTGLALTDDLQFSDHLKRWGIEAERPTHGGLVRERTASIVWDMLHKIERHIFLWNVFPLHPHPKNTTFGNRAHNAAERKVGCLMLVSILTMLRPRRVVAVGNDAAWVLNSLVVGPELLRVRHPSYGGEAKFRSQLASLYL